jgi:hypothetical protein
MAEIPKRTAFELDTEEDSSDLELSKFPGSDLKNNPTQPALEVEEVVEDHSESAMSSLGINWLNLDVCPWPASPGPIYRWPDLEYPVGFDTN